MTATMREHSGAIALVANYESDVGYAWWLMENFWAVIALEAAARGRKCVLAYPIINTIPRIIQDAPIEIREFRFGRSSWKDVLRTARFLRDHKVESVYLTDWPYLHWGYLLWRLYGVTRIVMHDHTPGVRPPIRGVRGAIKRFLFSLRVFSCDQYVAVSKYVGRRHVENACVPSKLGVVVENGIVPFDPVTSARAGVRTRLQVPNDAFLIVLVSRATYYKGIDFAVRALASVLKQDPTASIYAVHCGDGPDLEAFKKLTTEENVADRFRFLGRRSDVREILASADLAFHPSRGEAMSLALLEFMCAGLPVVVPDDASVCTNVEHEVSGLVYPKGDLQAAAHALRSLYEDRKKCAQLGEQARAICLERYTLERTNRSFTEQVVSSL